jgi:hypothetical protein
LELLCPFVTGIRLASPNEDSMKIKLNDFNVENQT